MKKYISKTVRANSVNEAIGKVSMIGYKYLGHIVLKRAYAKNQGIYSVSLERKIKWKFAKDVNILFHHITKNDFVLIVDMV